MSKLPVVVCAACRNKDGIIVCGARHYDMIMHQQIDNSTANWEVGTVDQGFIDQWGNWLTREEAHVIAKKNGQIVRRCGGDDVKLFSENLY